MQKLCSNYHGPYCAKKITEALDRTQQDAAKQLHLCHFYVVAGMENETDQADEEDVNRCKSEASTIWLWVSVGHSTWKPDTTLMA